MGTLDFNETIRTCAGSPLAKLLPRRWVLCRAARRGFGRLCRPTNGTIPQAIRSEALLAIL